MAVVGRQFQLRVILPFLQSCSLVTWPELVIEPLLRHKCLQSAKWLDAWMRQLVGEFLRMQYTSIFIKRQLPIFIFAHWPRMKPNFSIFWWIFFCPTNLNGHKLPVLKTMAKQGQLVSIFLYFFHRMELNNQRINSRPLFVQTTISVVNPGAFVSAKILFWDPTRKTRLHQRRI